jgi:hypothetical protein
MTIRLKKSLFDSLIFLLIITLTGCSLNDNKGIKTIIKGSFPAFKGKFVSLSEFDVNSALPVDTVKISDDGSFRFKFRRTGPGFYLVKIDNRNYLTLVLDQDNKVEISSDLPNLRKNYNVKGSPDSELYRDFEIYLEANRSKVDSLSKTYNDNQRSSTFRYLKMDLDKTYQEIYENQRQYAINLLTNHCSSLTSLLVINRRFGERKLLTEENDYQYFTLIDSCLSLKYPDNKHLADLKKRIGIYDEKKKISDMTEKRLAIGNKVPDISLQNPSGKSIPLYSLEGRPVILYFWASWDQQSRKSNLFLKELLAKAGKEKPSVYAVALESYKEMWDDAIRKDGLQNWTNVTDFLNIYSSAKTLFNIPDDFPYFILLDKQLIIHYKGNDFDELLKEIIRLNQ